MTYSTEQLTPPLAAAVAIMPTYRDMAAKTALQKGLPVPPMTFFQGLKGGAGAAPTVGAIVGTQMILQGTLEKWLTGDATPVPFSTKFLSSGAVGVLSSPFIAIFNGQTMGWKAIESLRRFSPKQAAAISVQEAAFVGGLSAGGKISELFGSHVLIDYAAAFGAGAAGSLLGHPANTALTRWQNKMRVDSFSQSMLGAARKARAVGCFSVIYKFCNDLSALS